jgi:hypothetical protein
MHVMDNRDFMIRTNGKGNTTISRIDESSMKPIVAWRTFHSFWRTHYAHLHLSVQSKEIAEGAAERNDVQSGNGSNIDCDDDS